MTAIKATVQLWQRRLIQGRPIEADRLLAEIARIDSQTTKMGKMIDDLLDMTRLQIGQQPSLASQELDLIALAHRVAQIQQSTTNLHRIILKASVPELMVPGDPLWLERVCTNLLSNAIKYSLPGGTITVTISQEKDETNSWAKLTVQDQGLGIPAEEVSHIFEPFYRASNVLNNIAGTGIGLASVAQIVEQHGGTITVKSKEGKGTTFTIHLPLMKHATTE